MRLKTQLEYEDVRAIAKEVVEMLKPIIANNGKQDGDALFSTNELCQYLGVSKRWVHDRTRFKEIPHIKRGNKLLL